MDLGIWDGVFRRKPSDSGTLPQIHLTLNYYYYIYYYSKVLCVTCVYQRVLTYRCYVRPQTSSLCFRQCFVLVQDSVCSDDYRQCEGHETAADDHRERELRGYLDPARCSLGDAGIFRTGHVRILGELVVCPARHLFVSAVYAHVIHCEVRPGIGRFSRHAVAPAHSMTMTIVKSTAAAMPANHARMTPVTMTLATLRPVTR